MAEPGKQETGAWVHWDVEQYVDLDDDLDDDQYVDLDDDLDDDQYVDLDLDLDDDQDDDWDVHQMLTKMLI